MPLIQVKFVEGSFVPTLKKEIVGRLANVIRARKRPCATSSEPPSQTPSGVNEASAVRP